MGIEGPIDKPPPPPPPEPAPDLSAVSEPGQDRAARWTEDTSAEIGRLEQGLEPAFRETFTDKPSAWEPQPFDNLDDLYAAAEHAQPGFEEILDKDAGASVELGAQVVDTSSRGGFEEAKRTVEANPDGSYVVLPGLKDRLGAEAKVNGKYAGDASRLGDVVRGTVLVPSPADVPETVDTMTKQAESRGWTVTSYENNMIAIDGLDNSLGAYGSGYRDVKLTLTSPEGLKSECQINTTDNWLAKEVDGGHTELYEPQRAILRGANEQGRDPTQVEHVEMLNYTVDSQELYGLGWLESLKRT